MFELSLSLLYRPFKIVFFFLPFCFSNNNSRTHRMEKQSSTSIDDWA
jgi:hypothetical protein